MKICGLTRVEDALLACELGAWAIGLVFAPSPRQLSLGAAAELVRSLRACGVTSPLETADCSPGKCAKSPFVVGVFAEVSAEEVVGTALEVGLDGVQLHGEGGPDAWTLRTSLRREGCSALIIRTVPVEPELDPAGGSRLARRASEVARDADLVLLDTRTSGGFGGTGKAFPWQYAGALTIDAPVLIAGGIRPENVARALLASGAQGVDVSSGVESEPGVKDPELMRRLFRAVQETSREQRRKERDPR